MARLHRLSCALLLTGALAPLATAQAPPAPTQQPARSRVVPAAPATTAASQPRRKSIIHHYPYPYAGYYYNDRTAGFRNPGGVGRYAEYYPPGDRFQTDGVDPVRVASFERGGAPTMADQRAAQQIGIQRENAIQQHIDNYARPYYGYGFGVGFFGGFN